MSTQLLIRPITKYSSVRQSTTRWSHHGLWPGHRSSRRFSRWCAI